MREKWILENKRADFNEIARKYGISPLVVKIMVNRGVTEDEDICKYIGGDIQDMYDPRGLKDIEKAVLILKEAIQGKEKIAIASDFDCDGIFSSMVLFSALQRLGAEVSIYTPNRVTEGYGLNRRIIDQSKEEGADVIITCDNGISAIEEIGYAKQLGLKVVVTDHHEVVYQEDAEGDRAYMLPAADAIVNPKQSDCRYPFNTICGATVAYKVMELLYEEFHLPKEELYELLEFVAIATITDVMDLVDENRIIVKSGLERLRNTNNIGLKAIMEVNNINPENLSTYAIGFVIGPCFNAAGRLETVKLALDLLMSQKEDEARVLALQLKELNDSRKSMTMRGFEQAIVLVEESELQEDKVIVLLLQDCHESLAGIIAGRVKERYHRPVFVFVKTEDGVKGSGRSIEAYHMFEELVCCKELLTKFGGHHMAAGMTLPLHSLEELRSQLNANAKLTTEDMTPTVRIDAALPIEYINEKLIEELAILEPFGKGNGKPVFAGQHFKILKASIMGVNKNVMKLSLSNEQDKKIEGMFFGDELREFMELEYGLDEMEKALAGRSNGIDIGFTFYPNINEYNGNRSMQIIIQHYCRIQQK